jgi:hypothetical protein
MSGGHRPRTKVKICYSRHYVEDKPRVGLLPSLVPRAISSAAHQAECVWCLRRLEVRAKKIAPASEAWIDLCPRCTEIVSAQLMLSKMMTARRRQRSKDTVCAS